MSSQEEQENVPIAILISSDEPPPYSEEEPNDIDDVSQVVGRRGHGRDPSVVMYEYIDRGREFVQANAEKPGFLMNMINVVLFIMGCVLCIIATHVYMKTGYSYSLVPLAVIGGVLAMLAIIGIESRGKPQSVLVYLYLAEFCVACVMLLSVSAIFFQDGLEVYIRHWWPDDSMAYFREEYCFGDTADTKCLAPLLDGADWCEKGCPTAGGEKGCDEPSYDCIKIRDDAIKAATDWTDDNFLEVGLLGVVCMVLLGLGIVEGERLVTPQVVAANVPNKIQWLLTLIGAGMVAGSLAVGDSAASFISYDSEADQIQAVLLGLGVVLLVGGVLRWLCMNPYSRNSLLGLVGYQVCTCTALLVVGGLVWARGDEYREGGADKTTDELQDIACLMRVHGCGHCDDFQRSREASDEQRCPSWEDDEIEVILETNLKLFALVMFVFASWQALAARGLVHLRKQAPPSLKRQNRAFSADLGVEMVGYADGGGGGHY